MGNRMRGMGRALQEAMVRDGPGEDLEIQGPSLANARRRQVFRYLCGKPCARVAEMCRRLELSQATVRWHERNLLEFGYLDMEGNRTFPLGLIDPTDAALFVLLAAPGRSSVLAACASEPGVCLQDVGSRAGMTRQSASKIASELAAAGLLRIVEDGRFRRLHPTSLLADKREANRGRSRAFVDRLVRRLQEDGLQPEMLRWDGAVALIRFGIGGRHIVLDIPVDPYATAWQPTLGPAR